MRHDLVPPFVQRESDERVLVGDQPRIGKPSEKVKGIAREHSKVTVHDGDPFGGLAKNLT